MAIFKGSGVAIVTPFNDKNEVDFDCLKKLIDFQIDHGTDAIIIVGTTGESATLSEEEHRQCVRAAVEFTAKRVPVIAGTGSNNTEHAIALSKTAAKEGADAILVVTPYYNKATQNGLVWHFTKIAASMDLPMIMYNVPSRTGCNIQPQTAAKLARAVDNIVAIKDAAGDISQTLQTRMLAGEHLDIYSGNDDQVIPILSAGGIGVISVLANVAPTQTHDMVMEYLNGNREKALKIQLDALPLIKALFSEVNPIPVKRALNFMGMNVGSLRMPLTEMEDTNAAKLKEVMKEYGLL